MVSLTVGLIAGLIRIGWDFSISNAVPHHGAIMIGGFLGTLISLEKIIPLKKAYFYIIPLTSALAVLMFVLGEARPGFILLLIASVGLTFVFLIYFMRNPGAIYGMMFAGAIAWVIGNAMLMKTNFYPAAVPWWMAFALLVILSERVELMKFLPVSKTAKLIFYSLLALFVAGCVLSFHGPGRLIASISIAAIAIWLLRCDVVAVSIRKNGLTKFVATTLLAGYFFLLLTGLLMFIFTSEAFSYDLIIHSFFIGFVFCMIFAHGPIILPGVLGLSIKPYSKVLYFWLAVLLLSLIMRIVGNVSLAHSIRKYSGMITAISVTGYFSSVVYLLSRFVRRNGKIS
jgi:hypothetical protein